MRYADRWATVRVEVDEGIAWVELNRPEERNAMSWNQAEDYLYAKLEQFLDEKRIKPGLQAYERLTRS